MASTHVISVDWLQVYCTKPHTREFLLSELIAINGYEFTVTRDGHQTSVFSSCYTVKQHNLVVATIQSNPRSPSIPQDMVLIKLDNRVLYHSGYIKLLYSLMTALNVTYKGITRLDVCLDCVSFKDGRSPSRFINDFISSRNISNGSIRKRGSEEFTAHGKKPSGGAPKINYLRFGSPKSKVSAYIYDKTLELSEVKDKPWIRSAWEAAGMQVGAKHVFRSEISIKAGGTDILNMSTGELFKLSPDFMDTQHKVENIFNIYAKKYFDFRLCNGQKYKKDFKRIELFDLSQPSEYKPTQISYAHDTGRIEKVCYNVLERLSSTYTNLSEYHQSAIRDTQIFLKELQGLKEGREAVLCKNSYLRSLKAHMFLSQTGDAYIDALDAYHDSQKEYRSLLEAQSEWQALPFQKPYYPNEVSLIDKVSESELLEYTMLFS